MLHLFFSKLIKFGSPPERLKPTTMFSGSLPACGRPQGSSTNGGPGLEEGVGAGLSLLGTPWLPASSQAPIPSQGSSEVTAHPSPQSPTSRPSPSLALCVSRHCNIPLCGALENPLCCRPVSGEPLPEVEPLPSYTQSTWMSPLG